jgi:hypothetical protein
MTRNVRLSRTMLSHCICYLGMVSTMGIIDTASLLRPLAPPFSVLVSADQALPHEDDSLQTAYSPETHSYATQLTALLT